VEVSDSELRIKKEGESPPMGIDEIIRIFPSWNEGVKGNALKKGRVENQIPSQKERRGNETISGRKDLLPDLIHPFRLIPQKTPPEMLGREEDLPIPIHIKTTLPAHHFSIPFLMKMLTGNV
jgi:hypothetical protein